MENQAPVTKEQKAVISQMSEELRDKYRVIRQKLVVADQDDLMMRYEIGVEVVEVLDNESRYGSHALVQLSEALGGDMSDSELYHYAQLARTFTATELEKLSKRYTKKGNVISWGKLRELLPLEPGQRKTLLKRLFEEDLTVRQLAALKKELTGASGKAGRGPSIPKTPIAACDQIHKLIGELQKRHEYWEDSLFAKIRELPMDELASQEVLLDRLRTIDADVTWLQDTAGDLKYQVDQALRRVMGEVVNAERVAQQRSKQRSDEDEADLAAEEPASPQLPKKVGPKASKTAKAAKAAKAGKAGNKPSPVKHAGAGGKAGSVANRVSRARAAAAAR